MRNIVYIFCFLVWLMPSLVFATPAVKGVRGTRRLQVSPPLGPEPPKVKKCKKFMDPKAALLPNATIEPKTTLGPKSTIAPKATPEPRAIGLEPTVDPKSLDPNVADPVPTKEADTKATPEDECLEWEYVTDRKNGGSDQNIVSEPSYGSTTNSSKFQSINVDCGAIADDQGPTDTYSVSFNVNIDIVKDVPSSMRDIYSAMEKELQSKVAPRIADCSDGRRVLAQPSTKIVNVDFGKFEFDHSGCGSPLAKEAAQLEGVCMESDIPVDVYFVGDMPSNAKAKVEIAIDEHDWNVGGLLKTSDVQVTQTGSNMGGSGGSGGPNPGIFIGVGTALVIAAAAAFVYIKKSQEAPLAKAELETDEESSDDEKIPEAEAMAIDDKK